MAVPAARTQNGSTGLGSRSKGRTAALSDFLLMAFILPPFFLLCAGSILEGTFGELQINVF